jgi:hypothetical protein
VKSPHTYDFKWRRKAADSFADDVCWAPGWMAERWNMRGRHPLTREQLEWLHSVLEHEAERLIEKSKARERKRLREGKVIRQGRA